MPFRVSKSVAALCIAIAVFAVFVPTAALAPPIAILTPRWLLVPPQTTSDLRSVETHSGCEQLVACLSLVLSRAPPAV